MKILCFINFAAGCKIQSFIKSCTIWLFIEIFILALRFIPRFECKKKCDTIEFEIKNYCTYGLKYCVYVPGSGAIVEEIKGKGTCRIRDADGGPSYSKMGTSCRETCTKDERQLKELDTVCPHGLTCCINPDLAD